MNSNLEVVRPPYQAFAFGDIPYTDTAAHMQPLQAR